MKIKIELVKHHKLEKSILLKIIKLKRQEWKNKLDDQILWIKNNIKKNDIHVILYNEKFIIGYTLLRKRVIKTNSKQIINFYLFDTHIIDKNYRKKKINNIALSRILMDTILDFIISKKLISLLFCKQKLTRYYRSFGWKVFDKRKIINYNKKNLVAMFFGKNLKNKEYQIKI